MNIKTNKGFIPVIIILLVLVGLGIFYFAKSQEGIAIARPVPDFVTSNEISDPTASWKTLTLLNNTVSIEYPDSIYLEKDGSDNFAVALSYKGESHMNGGFRIDATFTQQYADFTKAIKETEIYFKPYTNFKKQTLQNGIVKMSGVFDTDVRVIALVDYKGKAIAFDYLSQREKVSPEIFNQILSTFKFTN